MKEFNVEVDEILFKAGHVQTPDNLLAYKYLMEAVGRSSTIKRLTLRYLTTLEQWDLIIKALAQNTSITNIDFNTNNLTYVARALKAHEVLVECALTLPTHLQDAGLEELGSALRASKSLTSFELHGASVREASGTVAILKALKEHRGLVTCRLKALSFTADTGRTLASMIRYNEGLTALRLAKCDLDASTEPLCEVLRLNTSITELDLSSANFTPANMTKVLQIFKDNTTVTSLILDESNLASVQQELAALLKATTALKKLSLVNCHLDFTTLKSGLAKNNSLTWLSLAKNKLAGEWLKLFLRRSNVRSLCLDDCAMEGWYGRFVFEALENNCALTSLHMRNVDLDESALYSLGSMLRLNKTLRVLHIRRGTAISMPIQPVLIALATNRTLAVLHIDKIREQYHPEWDMISKLSILPANTSLVRLTINGEVDPTVERGLKANRDRYVGAVVFLKLMVKRPDIFFDIFPMEIWTKICSNIEGANIRDIFSTDQS